jgi:hypothetical protein
LANVITEAGRHRIRLEKLLASTREIVRIASAYVTDDVLLSRAGNVEVRLLTSWSEDDIVTGATSLKSLRKLIVPQRVRCRVLPSRPKLHAKVYIFGKERALVTSANLTRSGLDDNIEVGVEMGGSLAAKLADWFDQHWDSEPARVLTEAMIDDMEQRTAVLRRRFRQLRALTQKVRSPVKELPVHVPSSAGWFLCNTDRKHGFEREKLMYERGFAVAWEAFRSTDQMKKVRKDSVILMYANRLGIIGVWTSARPSGKTVGG